MAKSWKEQGGAAFPVPASDHWQVQDGMSLRDWFAGQALAVVAADYSVLGPTGVAKVAYEIADAMLERGEKR